MARTALTGITAGVNDGPSGVMTNYNANVTALNAMTLELYQSKPLYASSVHDWGTVNAGATATWEYSPAEFGSLVTGAGVVLGWNDSPLPAGIIAQAFQDSTGLVTITLTNVTGGNIVVGSVTAHVWAFPVPA